MTLGEHLIELRTRLMISVGAVLVFMAIVGFVGYNDMLKLLQQPYCSISPHHCTFLATGPLDGLTLRIKIALFGGLFLASPIVFYEIWRFITPGLKAKEKKYIIPFVTASLVFFAGGALLAYYSFEHALKFLQASGRMEKNATRLMATIRILRLNSAEEALQLPPPKYPVLVNGNQIFHT